MPSIDNMTLVTDYVLVSENVAVGLVNYALCVIKEELWKKAAVGEHMYWVLVKII
jgi:hypothetical protein